MRACQRLVVLGGEPLGLPGARLGGGERRLIGAALLVHALQRTAPVLHLASQRAQLLLEHLGALALLGERAFEFHAPRAALIEFRLVLGRLGGGRARAGARSLDRGGEIHPLGEQTAQLALALRLGGVVLFGDRGQRADTLAACLQLRLQEGDVAVQPLCLAPPIAQLGITLGEACPEGGHLLIELLDARGPLGELRVLLAQARLRDHELVREPGQVGLAPVRLLVQVRHEILEQRAAALHALQGLEVTHGAGPLTVQVRHDAGRVRRVRALALGALLLVMQLAGPLGLRRLRLLLQALIELRRLRGGAAQLLARRWRAPPPAAGCVVRRRCVPG